MKTLTIRDAKLMGDFDKKYGQAYWCEVEEEDEPVRFNLMKQHDFMPGDVIIAEEWAMKTSAKGTDYMQLRKVKPAVKDTEPTQVGAVLDPDTDKQFERIKESIGGESFPGEAGTNARWAIRMAFDSYIRAIGYPPDDEGSESMWASIELAANRLVEMFNNVKTGKPVVKPEPKMTELKAKAERWISDPPHGDEDAPEPEEPDVA